MRELKCQLSASKDVSAFNDTPLSTGNVPVPSPHPPPYLPQEKHVVLKSAESELARVTAHHQAAKAETEVDLYI